VVQNHESIGFHFTFAQIQPNLLQELTSLGFNTISDHPQLRCRHDLVVMKLGVEATTLLK